MIKRIMPHSSEAEQAVIGSMMTDIDAVGDALDILTKEDFYTKRYALMFECMTELYNESKPIDLVTLQERLREKSAPAEVSSIEAIAEIASSVPTSANIKQYAHIVREKSVIRKLIRANEDVADACYSGNMQTEELLEKAEKDIFEVLQVKRNEDFTPIHQVSSDVIHKISQASRTKEIVTGVPTGFIDLDNKTSGMQPSDFVLIAARPSMGKTAFALNIIQAVTMRQKKRPTLMFSLEMSKEQLVNRLLAMESGIDSQKLRTGNLTDAEWADLMRASDTVSKSSLVIDDTPGITVTEVRSKCRKLKLEMGLDLIVIDYLQLMSASTSRNDSRQQEISDISRNLKSLAREMKAPVIALSQLSRAPEQRPDHRPMLSDLRESGAIEQDADIAMFIYRDDYYHPETDHPGEAEIIIAKQRNGPIGTVKLLWKPELTKFVNIERSRTY